MLPPRQRILKRGVVLTCVERQSGVYYGRAHRIRRRLVTLKQSDADEDERSDAGGEEDRRWLMCPGPSQEHVLTNAKAQIHTSASQGICGYFWFVRM
jgi:predicted exporter